MSVIGRLKERFEATAHIPAPLAGDEVLDHAGDPVPAAVLVAIVDRPEPGLLLTRRNETLRKHPGQVAFAGGRADPEDANPVATALREAWEEIGLLPEQVSVIGCDAPYHTITGYRIVPVVGVVPPDLPLIKREIEVADIFEVPLAHVLDPAHHIRRQAEVRGVRRQFYEIQCDTHYIWGATAAMIVNLSRRIAV